MVIVETTKLRIEELCNERGLKSYRLATTSDVRTQSLNQLFIIKAKIQVKLQLRKFVMD